MDSLNEQFSRIYDQYIEKIYRFIYLKVNSQEIAEDITSKVFIKGWESYQKQGAGIEKPGAFLYQIARNSVIDHYRERDRSKIVSSDLRPEIADPGASIHDRAVLRADIEAIKANIQKLDKDYQDIIIWYYLEDMPIAQIAKLLDRPAGTIRVMLHRGLKDLKDIVQES